MKKNSLELPDKIDLIVLDVKCLTNFELNPNPRTKCWKITVPYKFKDIMTCDDLYYSGWTHRPYYPPKLNKAKRHQLDPNDPVNQHIASKSNLANGDNQSVMVGA